MAKIVFMGAGSSVFVKNVVGDCMLSPVLKDSEFALYDIDPVRLEDSRRMLTALNHNMGGHAQITAYLGVEKRREALRGAAYVIKEVYGKPPREMLAVVRTEQAQYMLLNTALPLEQVALSCGYANESHFCVSFKRESGFSPMEFRKSRSDILWDE